MVVVTNSYKAVQERKDALCQDLSPSTVFLRTIDMLERLGKCSLLHSCSRLHAANLLRRVCEIKEQELQASSRDLKRSPSCVGAGYICIETRQSRLLLRACGAGLKFGPENLGTIECFSVLCTSLSYAHPHNLLATAFNM